MPDTLEPQGCIRAFAAVLAISAWSAVAAFVLHNLDIDPWWAALAGLGALGILGFTALLAGYLERAAGAVYLKRIESEKLTAFPEAAGDAELLKTWATDEPEAEGEEP